MGKMFTTLLAAAILQIPQATAGLELPKSVKANTPLKASITLSIPEGNHAYAPAKNSMYITVEVLAPEGSKYKLTQVTYPKGESKTYPGLGDEVALVYEGAIKIPVQISMPKGTKDRFAFKLNVRVQMCTNEGGTCFPPQTIALAGSLKVTK
jgi:hypothetical protein